MSYGHTQLHSHSGLERLLNFPKHTVLVDAKYKDLFCEDVIKRFVYNKVEYYQVPILLFVKKGGVFKNLIR